MSQGELTTRAVADAPATPREEGRLPRGAEVGRYTIVGPLGAGGMAVVYLARDPELDRTVAIKVLAEGWGGTHQRTADLLREGRIAARLAHPNVVRVFDVGRYGHETFIAMEHLEGRTLERWLAEAQRSSAEILAAFIDAGRGLAAAHEAGLVHGDFKPRNVMVTHDGRVVVLDFGLGAHVAEERSAAEGDTGPAMPAGTPPFMAPELFEGAAASMRSDQFAFCVALYSALVGEHPFGPEPLAQRTGDAHPPPGAAMPRRVWRALERGLARDASARHDDLTRLLAELTPPRGPSRWVVGIVAGALSASLVYASSREPAPRCDAGASAMAAVWGADAKAELDARFDPSAWTPVRARLDALSDAWAQQWERACVAHHVERTESVAAYGRRALCLDRARAEIAAVVEFLRSSAGSPSGAAPVLAGLRGGVPCGEANALVGESVDEPEALAELEQDIARDNTLAAFGSERAAVLQRIEERVQRADALGSNIAAARAYFAWGNALRGAEQDDDATQRYQDAARRAELAGDDALAATVAAYLVHNAALQGRPDAAAVWAEYGRTKMARAQGGTGETAISLLTAEATDAQRSGDVARAVRLLQEALDQQDRTGSANVGLVGDATAQLAMAYLALGDDERALTTAQRAVELRREAFGDAHPLLGKAIYNLATVHVDRGELEVAQRELERATAILEHEPGGARQAAGLANMFGALLAEGGDLERAGAVLQAAVDDARRTLDPGAYELNPLLINLARVRMLQGRASAATVLVREGIAIAEGARSRDYPPLVVDLVLLAEAQVLAGDPAAAIPTLERARTLATDDDKRADIDALLTQARDRVESALPP